MHQDERFRSAGWHRAGLAAAALLAWVAAPASAAADPLSDSDLQLALYASADGGVTWSASPLTGNALAGFFGPHRCLCPDTLLVQVQLTPAGQKKLGSSSTLSASFQLGANCQTGAASCVAVGQVSFSGTQTAASPTFSSDVVFRAAAGGATVTCGSLTASSTSLWATLAQDGIALPFGLSLTLPVTATTLSAPTAVTAEPANHGIQVSWKPAADAARVAAYQVLCLPRPSAAFKAGYESCGLDTVTAATSLTAADTSELCSSPVSASTTSLRLTGLTNDTLYTVAVVAIDAGGGVSGLSPQAQATPQTTIGFYEKYRQEGGAATGCALARGGGTRGGGAISLLLVLAALGLAFRRSGKHVGRIVLLCLVGGGAARAQAIHHDDSWAEERSVRNDHFPVEWGLEVGVSLYRPAVDSELGDGSHPFAETFSNSRRLLSEAELSRYLAHRHGTWGLGLRVGYYKATAAAFLSDGTRSGDETGLRLIPFALSAIYRAADLPGLRRLPLIPYAKLGLDGVMWTASSSGAGSQTGFSSGWHVAGGLIFSLSFLAGSETAPGAIAGPGALFFEWDYSAINGFGLGHALHVGDSTWFAGLMFDL